MKPYRPRFGMPKFLKSLICLLSGTKKKRPEPLPKGTGKEKITDPLKLRILLPVLEKKSTKNPFPRTFLMRRLDFSTISGITNSAIVKS